MRLTDAQLTILEKAGSSDVQDMVREIHTLREQVATLTDLVERQQIYIKELRRDLQELTL